MTAGSEADTSTRVWDLSSGTEVGRLRHDAQVKALQVEDELCITAGADSCVKIWDLRKVDDWESKLEMRAESGQWTPMPSSSANRELGGSGGRCGDGDADGGSSTGSSNATTAGGGEQGLRQGETGSRADDEVSSAAKDEADPKLRTLEGHSKAVTALYFDDTCLVTGASDKTLRQWDLNTGQCVLTMDILWAISNPTASQALGADSPPDSSPPSPDRSSSSTSMFASPTPSPRRPGLHTGYSTSLLVTPGSTAHGNLSDWSGNFSYPTPPLSDGSWELYTDFVGSSAIQFWGYALASGSADGAVRMWDMRTGQSHRTLLGHTAPVTCLQFDETHVISGGLDRSVRVWDLRTGTIVDTIRYDYPVSALQFDSRKIVAATGENDVKVSSRGVCAVCALCVCRVCAAMCACVCVISTLTVTLTLTTTATIFPFPLAPFATHHRSSTAQPCNTPPSPSTAT